MNLEKLSQLFTRKDRHREQKNLSMRTPESMVACTVLGQPVWTPRNYAALAQQGYAKNVIVHRCVNLIARGCASIPWLCHEKDYLVSDTPLPRLLARPAPQTAFAQFMESVVANLLLSGNSYVHAVGHAYPEELHSLRPDRMRVIPDGKGYVAGYEYQVDGHRVKLQERLAEGQLSVLHLKLFNPLNDWYGQSPLEAAACAIDQHNAVAAHNLSLLQNGGRPTGAMIINRDNHQRASDEEIQDLKADLKTILEGERNAGRVLLLEGDFEWREMGLSPRDLDFADGKNTSAREIAQAFNVPPMLVGIPGDATYANFKEARCHLWEDTIIPIAGHIMREFEKWLLSSFPDVDRLSLDLDSISALSPKRDELWNRLQNCDFLTDNEKRALLGFGPLQNAEE